MAQSWKDWIAALYRQSYLRLYRVAYRLTGSMETAEELTQDTFLWALLHGEELMTHPKPEAWLMRTLTNLVKNENRRLSSTEVSLETLFQRKTNFPPRSSRPLRGRSCPRNLPPPGSRRGLPQRSRNFGMTMSVRLLESLL